MPVTPADQAVRRAVSDILSVFLSNDGHGGSQLAPLRDRVYEEYAPIPVDANGLSGLFGGSSDLGLKDQNQFLFLEPIAGKKMLPFLTLQTSHKWVHFRAYVLLTMLDDHGALQALAIRYETDEGAPQTSGIVGSHDFCHAQLCRAINSRTRATTPSWLPESQPSFPLDADDQVGVVLCMLTSLYGGHHVYQRLRMTGPIGLNKHRKKIRALTSDDERA